jgi:hypothetical protein
MGRYGDGTRPTHAFSASDATHVTLPSVMSCNSTSPKRLPRSLHESASYDPAWRHLQVEEYLHYRRHQAEDEVPFVPPGSERTRQSSRARARCAKLTPKIYDSGIRVDAIEIIGRRAGRRKNCRIVTRIIFR